VAEIRRVVDLGQLLIADHSTTTARFDSPAARQ
jgi:hypothetical protein